MPFKHIITIKLLILTVLIFCLNTVFAQSYKKITTRIDSLSKAGLPKSALKEVDKLDALARREKNAPMQIQAVLYRMAFQVSTEEQNDVLNIKTLKIDIAKSDYPVKPVLQSLLASMYQGYYEQHRWEY